MTETEQPTVHPVWCDRTQCTADEQPPTHESYQGGGKAGEHRSAPVCGDWGALAYLTQALAPWETSVFLRIEPNGRPESAKDSFELHPESPLLLMIRQHVAEQQRRYPTLVPELDVDESAGRA